MAQQVKDPCLITQVKPAVVAHVCKLTTPNERQKGDTGELAEGSWASQSGICRTAVETKRACPKR